ncbi:hypothetical protein ACG9VV_000863 [Vibrio alginolyticus]|uniref:hypothetical protein n=1 Tax=Vibrio alginolyticus TaxID=663 RepID=UPI0037497FA4
MSYKTSASAYDLPVLVKTLSERTNKETGETFTPVRTHIDTRAMHDYLFSSLQLSVFDDDGYTCSLNIVGFDIGNGKYTTADSRLYFNFKNNSAFRGFGRAQTWSKQTSEAFNRKHKEQWWDETKEIFESIIEQNMTQGRRGRTKKPEFYTAGLVQARDNKRISEQACAMIIVKEFQLLFVMRIGSVIVIREINEDTAKNYFASNIKVTPEECFDIDSYSEYENTTTSFDKSLKAIEEHVNSGDIDILYNSLNKIGFIEATLDMGLRNSLMSKSCATQIYAGPVGERTDSNLISLLNELETLELREIVKQLSKVKFFTKALDAGCFNVEDSEPRQITTL